jgi:Ca2+-dependent lipid-binding protein
VIARLTLSFADTTAIGVFIITIHYAEDLSAQDSNGKSDPYVVLAYAKVCRRIPLGKESRSWFRSVW